jgi:hypothetical protein
MGEEGGGLDEVGLLIQVRKLALAIIEIEVEE